MQRMRRKELLRIRHLIRYAGGRRQGERLLRHYNPGYDVRQKSDSATDRSDQPYNADQGHVESEILREPQTNSGDFASMAWPHQTLPGNYTSHILAAVSAMPRILLNDFAAVIAIHVLHSSKPGKSAQVLR